MSKGELLTEEPKLDSEAKARWIEALRSGRYVQGQQYLRPTDNTFCCLGVLCDVLRPEGWEGHVWQDPEDFYGDDIENVELPGVTVKRLGFPKGAVAKLMEMNDEDNASFAEIADYIEKNL